MKKNYFLFASLFGFLFFGLFSGCKEDIEETFFNERYESVVTFQDGKEFSMSSTFKFQNIYDITIPVYYSHVANEADKYKYIQKITGKYQYARQGNDRVTIALNDIATVNYGYINNDSIVRLDTAHVFLQEIFPVRFDLDIKKGKLKSLPPTGPVNPGITVRSK
ncbi:MAG: hypothetical protein LBH12_06705 [Dysgonamonadaceae bacterium]|jgi:hypothetical protein|nr:hypothetical protein [Dysgonamonadaceae bacterium]